MGIEVKKNITDKQMLHLQRIDRVQNKFPKVYGSHYRWEGRAKKIAFLVYDLANMIGKGIIDQQICRSVQTFAKGTIVRGTIVKAMIVGLGSDWLY